MGANSTKNTLIGYVNTSYNEDILSYDVESVKKIPLNFNRADIVTKAKSSVAQGYSYR